MTELAGELIDPGTRGELDEGPALAWRQVGSSLLLAWYTSKPVDFVLDTVRQLRGVALDVDDASLLFRDEDDEGNDELEGTSNEIVDVALNHPDGVLATTVRFPGVHVAWVRADEADPRSHEAFARCNARFESYDHETVAALLGATAVAWDEELLTDLERSLDT